MSAERKAKLVKKFSSKNMPCFWAYYKAIEWLHKNGFSYGSMCRDEPICVMRGDVHIAKWKNLTTEEKESSDGLLISEDFRNGDVTLKLYCKVAK